MNNNLESNNTQSSTCRGEQFIIKGLLETIETSLGYEEAKIVAYNTGFKIGVKLGAKLGSGGIVDSFQRFINYVTPYYQVTNLGIDQHPDKYSASVRFDGCIIRKILGEGYASHPIGCRMTQGYIEGALSTMTGRKVEELVFESSIDSNTCVGQINFFNVPVSNQLKGETSAPRFLIK
ncbi:MAG: hypothetical protein P1P69_01215 [Methanosarcinaceae archaeon]|nr:hypothetical protein [Methanosarcinaceae archaeon]